VKGRMDEGEDMEFMESFMHVILNQIEVRDWSDKHFACMVWPDHAYPETTWNALKKRWSDGNVKRRRHIKLEDARRMAVAFGLSLGALVAMAEADLMTRRFSR